MESRKEHREGLPDLARPGGAVITFVIGTILSLIVFFLIQAWEESEVQRVFQFSAHNRLSAFQADFVFHREVVNSLAGLLSASPDISREEFRTFVQGTLIHHPDIQELSWNPLIKDSEQEQFIARAKKDGVEKFRITASDNRDRGMNAAQADEQVVVFYIEPYSENESILGLDLTSWPELRDAVRRARESGEMVVTERIELTPGDEESYGYLLLKPVYRKGSRPDTTAARREHFIGVVAGGFRFNVSIPLTMREIQPFGVNVWISDLSAPKGRQFLYFLPSRPRSETYPPTQQDRIAAKKGLHLETSIDVQGRTWSFLFAPAPEFLKEYEYWQAWTALLIGISFSAMLSFYLRSETRHANRMTNLNLELIYQMEERRQAEEELKQAAAVFENTTEGVFITDAKGDVVAVNRAFADISGYTEEELIGLNPRAWKSDRHSEGFYISMWKSLAKNGRWQGEIWNRRKNGDVYPAWMTVNAIRNERGETTRYVAIFSDISSIKESQDELKHLAHHDPLTKLPNRLLFTARLEHALQHAHRHDRLVAVLFLDLDNFKHINDDLGHLIGDGVLQETARRLSGLMREDDTVARLGGDEFSIILEDTSDTKKVSLVADKILSAFEKPLEIGTHSLHMTTSIGISLYPHDGRDASTLVKHADMAMYQAKENGKNRYCFYSPEISLTQR